MTEKEFSMIKKRVAVVNENGKGTGAIGDLLGFTADEERSYGILLLPDGRFKEVPLALLVVLNSDGNKPVGVKS